MTITKPLLNYDQLLGIIGSDLSMSEMQELIEKVEF